VELEQETVGTTLGELLEIARERLGEEAVLEFEGELVTAMQCPDCGREEPVFRRMARLYENATTCPHCGGRRDMALTHRITGDEAFLDLSLAEVDVPPLSIIRARNGQARAYFELTGDSASFFEYE
jgi:adenylyltransferase/sulfurtransferase